MAAGDSIKCLVYADGLCIVSQEKRGIELMIQKIEEFTNSAQLLRFNMTKCAALSIINRGSRKFVEAYSSNLRNQSNPYHLGVQTGITHQSNLMELKDTIIAEATLKAKSLLTD